MNLLPKKYSHFRDKDYWNQFFQTLHQDRPFDWYGTLLTYKHPLFATINHIYNHNNKQKHIEIAHLGCGNSTLPQDILKTYPIFDFSICNLDYSEPLIAEMRAKNEENQTGKHLKYQVCDLLKPISTQLQGAFDLVIDKGTLDAILPEDKPQIIAQIKSIYFKNVEKMLNPSKKGHYIIVSMLQQFVLRTILETFQSHPHFQISISECYLPDSQLQPFYIDITFSPQGRKNSFVKLTLLSKIQILLDNPKQILLKVAELQQMSIFTKGIKQLRAGQFAKFNVHKENKAVRYMLTIMDSQDKRHLIKNNCAVFIVPPSLQSQFSTQSSLRQLHEQISTSRLVVVKPAIGQDIKSIQQIKDELNSVMTNLIQKGCDQSQVPYLTDGSFAQRRYLFRDQEIFIEEVLIQGQNFRRLILKNSPSIIQSQFKLTYLSQKSHPHLKQIPSTSLAPKKGLLPGIDAQYLDEGYCRVIVAGLSRLLNIRQSKGLHLGTGAAAIPKYLKQNYPQLRQTMVQNSKSVLINCAKYFEWPEESPSFNCVNADAQPFMQKQREEKIQYTFIIVDINSIQDDEQYPPHQFTQQKFIRNCVQCLQEEGVLVFNTISFQQNQKQSKLDQLLFSFKQITIVYRSVHTDSNVVYFACKTNLQKKCINDEEFFIVKDLMKVSGKQDKQWAQEAVKSVNIVKPLEGQAFKDSAIKVVFEEEGEKKKKKKKKK